MIDFILATKWYWLIAYSWPVTAFLNMFILFPLKIKLCDATYGKYTSDDVKNSIRFGPFASLAMIIIIALTMFSHVFGLFEYVPRIVNYIYGLERSDDIKKHNFK